MFISATGDVWNVQPAPKDHPWRTMKNPLGGGNGMTPHYSGTTLDAQARYAAGTKSILENYFEGREQEPANVIVGHGTWNYHKAVIFLLLIVKLLQAHGRPKLVSISFR